MVDQLLKAFSLYNNVPKLVNCRKSPSAIHCIHGIRFFSIMWIILGHTYNYGVVSDMDTPTTGQYRFPLYQFACLYLFIFVLMSQLRFKHAGLGTHFSYLSCLFRTVAKYFDGYIQLMFKHAGVGTHFSYL